LITQFNSVIELLVNGNHIEKVRDFFGSLAAVGVASEVRDGWGALGQIGRIQMQGVKTIADVLAIDAHDGNGSGTALPIERKEWISSTAWSWEGPDHADGECNVDERGRDKKILFLIATRDATQKSDGGSLRKAQKCGIRCVCWCMFWCMFDFEYLALCCVVLQRWPSS
jgi:hypothetical protein